MADSQRFIRAEVRAKNRPIRVDTGSQTQAVALTTVATSGTFDAAASAGALLLTINGTAVKIPYYTV